MKFDYIFGNPPFQDSKNRNKTQHKLWIEFTEKYFSRYLNNEGEMLWITPSSWGSPSNKIFKIFKKCEVKYLNLDIENFFSSQKKPSLRCTMTTQLVIMLYGMPKRS
jgi:hypothetical protein